MTTTAEKIVGIATAEVGYHEGFHGGHWDNIEKFAPQVPGLEWAQGQAWCDVFVAWVAMKAGAAELYPRSASCDVSAAWFKARKQWSDYPAVGAQIFYGTAADYVHTGLVIDYDATYVYTVEGNTNTSGAREGDGVYRKRHLRTSPHVGGYGYPKFPEGIKSADPRFKGAAPAGKTPARAAAAVAAAGVAAAVAGHTSAPAVAPKPVPTPVVVKHVAPKPACSIKITKGHAKFAGTCVITKGKS